MQSGLAISLGGHTALILAALIGWPFARAPEPAVPQSVSVSLVSPDQLETAPPPAAPAAQDAIAALPQPPAPEVAPRPSNRPEETPRTAAPQAPAAPPPVDRVAPVPQPPPPEEAREAEAVQPAIVPVPAPDATPAEPREAEAPEAAAPQIVTEATETAEAPVLAPDMVPRPVRRQDRPPEPVEPADLSPEAESAGDPEPELAETPAAPEPAPDAPDTEDAVAAALAEALSQPETPPAPAPAQPVTQVPAGPPLSASEREGLRVSVSRCWNFGALSTDAAKVTVVVAMSMSPDGRPVQGSIRLASWTGGSEDAAGQAYETARRAILRCGGEGYPLPVEKYEQWREIEMTFNPERMRQK